MSKHDKKYDAHPPSWADHLLESFCAPHLLEEVQGDLHELYGKWAEKYGVKKARWLYVLHSVKFFRPFVMRRSHFAYSNPNYFAMFTNYLKVSIRNLRKYKSYALLNIFGLSVGIAAAIVLFLIVRYERSFDTFHPGHEQVYRLGEQRGQNGKGNAYFQTKTPVVPTLIEEMPEVISGTRFFAPNFIRMRYQDHTVNPLVHYVDSGFVDLFDFGLIAGDLRQALTTADHIVLTESVAEKLFDRGEAVGKTVEVVNSEQQFIVGAVLPDPPQNSSLQFKALLPWLNRPDWLALDQSGDWYNTFMTGYVKLSKQADLTALSEKLIAFKDRYFESDNLENLRMVLLPLADLRAKETDNQAIITLLSIIAVITLLIASINFMNLATAQSMGRTREIGIRKVVGSLRSQVVMQFLTESIVTCLLALVVGILLVHIVLPWFNTYFDLALTFNYWQNLSLLGMLLAVGILTGLLSGAYPALFVSRMKPVESLKGQIKYRLSGRLFQQGLIALQYTASILLIAGTLIIWRQIQFMKSQDLQFDEENVAVFMLNYDNFDFQSKEQTTSAIETMINRLENESVVVSTTFAQQMPGRYNHNYNSFYDSEKPNQEPVSLRQVYVRDQYFETLGMDIVAGRTFSKALAPDSSYAAIINEVAMKAFGWEDVEGKYLIAGGDGMRHPVVGVVRDYHYQSLQYAIQPMIHFYYTGEEYYGHMAVRLQPGRTAEGLRVLEEAYNTLMPFEPFDYFFLDQEFERMYKEQERLGLTATLFAGIAIVLASLGLLGLAAFATRQRRKEVGVRKVLGASVAQIIMLLSSSFVRLVMIAFVVACPVVYFAAHRFLQDFAYRINLSADIFLIAGVTALLVAGLSVSLQAFRAASVNPVHSLRDE